MDKSITLSYNMKTNIKRYPKLMIMTVIRCIFTFPSRFEDKIQKITIKNFFLSLTRLSNPWLKKVYPLQSLR